MFTSGVDDFNREDYPNINKTSNIAASEGGDTDICTVKVSANHDLKQHRVMCTLPLGLTHIQNNKKKYTKINLSNHQIVQAYRQNIK